MERIKKHQHNTDDDPMVGKQWEWVKR